MTEHKRDLSVPMARATAIMLVFGIPVFIVQFVIFFLSQDADYIGLTFNPILLTLVTITSIATHELLHGFSWVIFGHTSLSMIKFGFQWKTLTPYAYLLVPIEISAYRIGVFMPGFILGLLPYVLSLLLGDSNLFLLGLFHTAAATGDWLVLWQTRAVKKGTIVEDHPTHAGCYVLEP